MSGAALPIAARPFTDFARRLRDHGFPVATEQTIAFLRSITVLGPKSIRDIYWAARATLAPAPDRLGEFDALFDAAFRGATGSIPKSDSGAGEDSPTSESDSGHLDLTTMDRANETGASATTAEALSVKRFLPGSVSSRLRSMQQRLPERAPHRRGYRHEAVRSGSRIDVRRSLSRMVRGGSGAAAPVLTKRQDRPRRILLLIDISGSMKSHTQDYLRFAHALTQTLPAVETFSFGTRLTRLTRSLRRRDLQRALAEIAPAVADWDGGTRIAASLNAFLAVPRFSRSTRSALVVVLSDGLERGDPVPMANAARRLAARSWRLAWLTPLAADPAFSPETAALRAILPIIDHLGDGSGIGPLCDFLEVAAHLGDTAPAAGRASASTGKTTHGHARYRRSPPHLAKAGFALAGRPHAAANLRAL
ncbi:MAG: VWA domain-containing protein [Devosia sp.]